MQKAHAVDRLRVKLNRTTTFFSYLVLIEKQAGRLVDKKTNHQCITIVTIYHHRPLHVHPLF